MCNREKKCAHPCCKSSRRSALYSGRSALLEWTICPCIKTVSKIKGAPCTPRAHSHGRLHDFRGCAPGVCTFFELFIIAIYWEGAWKIFRMHSFRGSAQDKSLISDTGLMIFADLTATGVAELCQLGFLSHLWASTL